jgi:hypothetical protein
MPLYNFLDSLSVSDVKDAYFTICGMALANVLNVENGKYTENDIPYKIVDHMFKDMRNYLIAEFSKEDVKALEEEFLNQTSDIRDVLKEKLRSLDDI